VSTEDVYWKQLDAWLGRPSTEDERALILETCHKYRDGYKAARELDDWNPDFEFCEMLDNIAGQL
jgi:hypothetical protein